MSDNTNLDFTKFVPGFDFLQNLAKGASQSIPQLPSLSNWVAPTLNVEELDKRIGELKAVHFWLDQNSKALGATIQALEVQKMTLATLQGMNFNMADVANALKLKAAESMMGGVQTSTEAAAGSAEAASGAAKAARGKAASKPAGKAGKAETPLIDPLQWWGSITQQFQQIAADALKDATRTTGVDAAAPTGASKDASKTAGATMHAATPGTGARPARKAAAKPRKTPARKAAAAR
jgi:hypothetical protein